MDIEIYHGRRFLKRYLAENSFAIHELDLAQFKTWVQAQLDRHKDDMSFQQRCRVRDIQKQHAPTLSHLYGELQSANDKWQTCTNKSRIEFLESEIFKSNKAIAGLTQAAQKKDAKRAACLQKLAQFQDKIAILQKEYDDILHSTPEREALNKAEALLLGFKNSIALTSNEEYLQQLFSEQGNRATRAGENFEKAAREIVEQRIVSSFHRKSKSMHTRNPKQIYVLSRVTLGCARAELDYVVVKSNAQTKPVEVLAIVEVKRNINDVAGGFAIRQENLAWFTHDETGYDPQIYRTRLFHLGHFDHGAYHEEHGQKFLFTDASFRYFGKHLFCNYFMHRLFFIVQYKTFLQGMSSAEYGKFLYKIATDIEFDPHNDDYLQNLLKWTKSTIAQFQTKDVLLLYNSHVRWAQQLFVVKI